MRRLNNKGFSLVELVVVIAIMAVLMSVLAPQLITYLEKSRASKDQSMLDEILHCTHITLSVDRVYNDSRTDGVVVSIESGSQVSANSDIVEEELLKIFPDVVKFESKKFTDRGGETIEITYSDPHGTFILEPSWDVEE